MIPTRSDWSHGWPNNLSIDHPMQPWNFFALPVDPEEPADRMRRWLSGEAFAGVPRFARYEMALARREAASS